MGVNIREIIIREPITLESLAGKTLIVDGHNALYQFLATIRARDGSLFTDHSGSVTSHLIGLFSRVTNLMHKKIRLAFVFDGKMPELKRGEIEKRIGRKKKAQEEYENALAVKDTSGMKKYAARTSRLTKEMIDEAKELLLHLGIPFVQAPSEGEAQAVHIVKKAEGWAVASQDYDSLLYGTPRLVQNLSVEGRRKAAGKLAYTKIEPLLTDLEKNLRQLGITREKLVWLAMLVGTDYSPGGVKGIGPKKALGIVRKYDDAKNLFEKYPLKDWEKIMELFEKMPVSDDYTLKWRTTDRKQLYEFLVRKHDFGAERVEKTMAQLDTGQKGLGEFV